ncbi:hypothetical protein DL98DRAFT_516772 [Cadophora sp. DSE1049]|nr:hypothetical protein DL98DRAFT_516772 [Cadophora sp. DSE1049]
MAASKSPISKLSVDHFSLISEYLSINDIRSTRLSNRELHFFLTPYLFRSITFASHQEYLDIIDAISRDFTLSSNVRVLRFDTTIFKRPGELEWLDDWPDFRGHGLEYPQLSFHNGFLCNQDPSERCLIVGNCSHRICQHDAINENLEKHLGRALERFPKINTVILSKGLKLDSMSHEARACLQQYPLSRIRIRRTQWLALFQAIVEHKSPISKLMSEGRWVKENYDHLDNGNFGDDSAIVGSIKHCMSDLETAVYDKEIPPSILSSDFRLNSKELVLTQQVFSNLTHLELHLFTTEELGKLDSLDMTGLPTSYWADFPKVVQSLTQVTNLSLDFRIRRMIDQQLEIYYFHDDLEELFANPLLTLPKLRSLSLSQFRSSVSNVKSLLERHPGIQNLKLKYIIEATDLTTYWDNPDDPIQRISSQWIEILEVLRSYKLKRLDLKGIEGFGICYHRHGSENENLLLASIHHYVLHGYGHNPLLQLKQNNKSQGLSPDWDQELW